MTLEHQTQKQTRSAATVDLAGDIIASETKSAANGKKEKGNGRNLESKKRKKSIAARIGRPLKSPLCNKDEEYEDGEEDVGTPIY